ncbi:MAG: glutamine-hydrolyzing carbamoyl-phosphate synthase small subunit [Bacteroidales bacterium]|nr:glutamine-hydrolyzing carbamoyl-phosphate synthase small subunit [Bacteroidales bacterium]
MKELEMKLVLENGQEFFGTGCGADKPVAGEIVFNTSMVGYQEIISDPAYAGQIVLMTYPLMGQYGITAEDNEARVSGLAGLVVRECCDTPSNFRYTKTISEEMIERKICGISGVDTRMLTRIIRKNGGMRAAITYASTPVEEALAMIKASEGKKDFVGEVSCTHRWFSRTPNHKFDVVVIDCGMKHSIVDELNDRGCNVTVVPFNSTAEEVLAFNPDGILISSGPGSPEDLPQIVELVKKLKGKLPVFGISLGQCIIGLAYGASVERLGCGHHGGRATRNIETGKIVTTEQNHNFALNADSLKKTALEITYTDVADSTVEGIECREDKVYAVQFYPEGGPGPRETDYFDKFVKTMEK